MFPVITTLVVHPCSINRLSCILLLACSLLTTSEDLFGKTIHCSPDSESISVDLFESFCFMAETYTVGSTNAATSLHRPLIQKGIAAALGRTGQKNNSQVKKPFIFSPWTTLRYKLSGLRMTLFDDIWTTSHKYFQAYYQWVGLLLVMQAGLAYLPWLIWKRAEGGRVSLTIHQMEKNREFSPWQSSTSSPGWQVVE